MTCRKKHYGIHSQLNHKTIQRCPVEILVKRLNEKFKAVKSETWPRETRCRVEMCPSENLGGRVQ